MTTTTTITSRPSTDKWLKNCERDYSGGFFSPRVSFYKPTHQSALTTCCPLYPTAGAAGVLVFVQCSEKNRVQKCLDLLNARDRVSDEVHSLYIVKPTRDAVKLLCSQLQAEPRLQDLEMIHKLKANNSLRDLTAKWRLFPPFTDNFLLVVGLETVNDQFRTKYPHPNLTLHAGKIELGESTIQAAVRELFEEARISVNRLEMPIKLMTRGLIMFVVYIQRHTILTNENHVLFIH